MSIARLRLALRDWDHVVPLVTQAVRPQGIELDLEMRATTPDVTAEPDLDGGETSFSRYAIGRANNSAELVGLPVFLMRGFRQRCVLVRRDSQLTELEQLAGARIGLTGWVDSGNTWTRALFRDAGVDLGGIDWSIGPLAAGETGKDRVGPLPLPANVSVLDDGDSLVDGLADGRFDAICTPFLPTEMFETDSRFRHLLGDYPAREAAYYRANGFVPGIHLLTIKQEAARRQPGLVDAVVDAFTASREHWRERRRLLTDTTPWLLSELTGEVEVFGADWMPYGACENKAMVEAFCAELHGQGITSDRLTFEALFSDFCQLSQR